MSKKSRRRNKMLLAGAALFGASKLGMLGGKGIPTGASGSSKSLFTSDKAYSPNKFKKAVGPTKKLTTKKTFPRLKVTSTGDVIKDGVNTGVGNTKTKFVNTDVSSGKKVGIYPGGKKVSELNPKAINVLSDGKISSGGKTYANKKEYASAMKSKRALKRNTVSKKSTKKNPGLFGFTFDKPLLNKGSMVKARGGGMARMKPTKLY